MNNTTYLKLDDASDVIGVSAYTLRQWCINDKIPYIKVGLKYMVDVEGTLNALRTNKEFKQ